MLGVQDHQVMSRRPVLVTAAGFSFRDAGKQAALIGSAAAASVAGGGGAVAHCTQVVTEAAAANGYSVREAGRLEYDGQFFIGYHVFLL